MMNHSQQWLSEAFFISTALDECKRIQMSNKMKNKKRQETRKKHENKFERINDFFPFSHSQGALFERVRGSRYFVIE